MKKQKRMKFFCSITMFWCGTEQSQHSEGRGRYNCEIQGQLVTLNENLSQTKA